jgi:hypothetical protein
MSAKKDMDVWAHFGEGGALSVDVVSRSEAEELSVRVAQLEDEVRPSAPRDLPASQEADLARAATDRDCISASLSTIPRIGKPSRGEPKNRARRPILTKPVPPRTPAT